MDPADRIPQALEEFTAAEAVAVLRRRQPIAEGVLLRDLRAYRIDQRLRFHLEAWDSLNQKLRENQDPPAWMRVQDNITRHNSAITLLQGITP